MAEIPETAISWEHDTGTIHIDTRSKAVTNRLIKLGFKPENPTSDDYMSFRTHESELRITLSRKREPSAKQLAARMASSERLAIGRNQAKNGSVSSEAAPRS